jgi:hypothetical protein
LVDHEAQFGWEIEEAEGLLVRRVLRALRHPTGVVGDFAEVAAACGTLVGVLSCDALRVCIYKLIGEKYLGRK